MDPRLNPYAPGAGAPPPELAGRDAIIEQAAIAFDRIRAGRYAKSLILVGLRGVGKTVLLNYADVELSLDVEPEADLADVADLDLARLACSEPLNY